MFIQLRLLDSLDIFKHFLSKSEWEDIDKTNKLLYWDLGEVYFKKSKLSLSSNICEARDLLYYFATMLFVDNKLKLSKRKIPRAKI